VYFSNHVVPCFHNNRVVHGFNDNNAPCVSRFRAVQKTEEMTMLYDVAKHYMNFY
jgi:hypothetical protein